MCDNSTVLSYDYVMMCFVITGVYPEFIYTPTELYTLSSTKTSICFILNQHQEYTKVDWRKDGQPMRLSARCKASKQKNEVRLDIDETTVADGGNYTVFISNRRGEAEASCSLHVCGKLMCSLSQYIYTVSSKRLVNT